MKNVPKFLVWAIQERHAGGGWERSSIGKGMEILPVAFYECCCTGLPEAGEFLNHLHVESGIEV